MDHGMEDWKVQRIGAVTSVHVPQAVGRLIRVHSPGAILLSIEHCSYKKYMGNSRQNIEAGIGSGGFGVSVTKEGTTRKMTEIGSLQIVMKSKREREIHVHAQRINQRLPPHSQVL